MTYFLISASVFRSKMKMAGGQTCFPPIATSTLPESSTHRRSHSSTWTLKTDVRPSQLPENCTNIIFFCFRPTIIKSEHRTTWLMPSPVRIRSQLWTLRLRVLRNIGQRNWNSLFPFWKRDEDLVLPNLKAKR